MIRLDRLDEGTRFRIARVAARLTLFDVGRQADVSPPRLGEFERGVGTLPPETVERVRAVLEAANAKPDPRNPFDASALTAQAKRVSAA